jgi:membrane peptidoglycan carboxypeptidase
MLDEVVRVGTGTAANLNPYTVAGKTGTAIVVGPKGYEPGHYVASFAGFVPAEAPKITAMVVIDNTPFFGAAASAPTFASIARDALRELEIPPLPKVPPAPGVPLSTTQSATGAGDVAGNPLPTIVSPISSAPAGATSKGAAPSNGATTSTTVATTGHPTTGHPTTTTPATPTSTTTRTSVTTPAPPRPRVPSPPTTVVTGPTTTAVPRPRSSPTTG